MNESKIVAGNDKKIQAVQKSIFQTIILIKAKTVEKKKRQKNESN